MRLTSDLLTVREAAEVLNYNPERVRELCREGKLPWAKIGVSYVFDRRELEEWRDKRDAARA